MEKLRILIAEDEALVAMGLEAMLNKLGHEVVGKARNGSEAVQISDALGLDMAIVDIKMPGMDGLLAARSILSEKPVPIIILTAYTDESLIKEADEIGVAAYLIKPVTEAALKPALRLAASRFHEIQELKKEVGSLKEALETRKLVERAKGIIMKKQNLNEEEAFRLLQKQSSRRNMKMGELSRMIVEASDFF